MSEAQIHIDSNQIVGTRWKRLSPVSANRSMELIFSDSIMSLNCYTTLDPDVNEVEYNIFTYPYYLSNDVPVNFDFSKVGHPSSGEYLVYYNRVMKKMDYYTVQLCDNLSLTLFYQMKDKKEVIDAHDTEFCYVRQSLAASHEVHLCEVCCLFDDSDKTAKVSNYDEFHLTEWKKGSINFPIIFKVDNLYYTITSIADSAFWNCVDVINAIIPNGVYKIGNLAFYGCKNLKTVSIPLGVKELNTGVFKNCENLQSFEAPSSVSHICTEAFSGCSKLSLVILPANISKLENSVFSGCSSLSTIECRSRKVPQITSRTFVGLNKKACTLYVPTFSVSDYKKADGWKDFNIVGKFFAENLVDWFGKMISAHNASFKSSDYNYFMHLGGPNGGYDVWLANSQEKRDAQSMLPKPSNRALTNGQGIFLSTVFSQNELNQMYQRARDLGVPYYSCASLLSKNDKLINMIFDGICAMANGYLYSSSPTDAKRYAEKLYDAFLHFKTDCATPEDLTLLCGGCDMPRYNK